MARLEEDRKDVRLSSVALPRLPSEWFFAHPFFYRPCPATAEHRQRIPSTKTTEITACADASYQFLEQFLLPRVLQPKPLTVEELVAAVERFRQQFNSQNRVQLPPCFELLSAVESIVVEFTDLLRDWVVIPEEVARLSLPLLRAEEELGELMDIYLDRLIAA